VGGSTVNIYTEHIDWLVGWLVSPNTLPPAQLEAAVTWAAGGNPYQLTDNVF
jgi:hypothetical protein